MSKSVYVMDTPKTCEECQFFRCSSVGEWFVCALKQTGITKAYFNKTRSDECPLVDIPERKDEIEPEELIHNESAILGEAVGLNECLDHILGGDDEND